MGKAGVGNKFYYNTTTPEWKVKFSKYVVLNPYYLIAQKTKNHKM